MKSFSLVLFIILLPDFFVCTITNLKVVVSRAPSPDPLKITDDPEYLLEKLKYHSLVVFPQLHLDLVYSARLPFYKYYSE